MGALLGSPDGEVPAQKSVVVVFSHQAPLLIFQKFPPKLTFTKFAILGDFGVRRASESMQMIRYYYIKQLNCSILFIKSSSTKPKTHKEELRNYLL